MCTQALASVETDKCVALKESCASLTAQNLVSVPPKF